MLNEFDNLLAEAIIWKYFGSLDTPASANEMRKARTPTNVTTNECGTLDK